MTTSGNDILSLLVIKKSLCTDVKKTINPELRQMMSRERNYLISFVDDCLKYCLKYSLSIQSY